MTSFMDMALDEARNAGQRGEVPVGCLLVRGDEVIVRTTCHWPDGWKTFGVPPHLLEHAMRAMTTWCDLVKQLSTQPIPPPPMPQLSAAPAPDDGLGIPEFLDRRKQTGATP